MNKHGSPSLTVACFGEVLWDCLPRGIFLGGAPLNVAYHLSRQGIAPRMISAVGRDFLGEEALRRLAAWGFDLSSIARRSSPTGTVRATLDEGGAASYVFDPCPAWDQIPASRQLIHGATPPVAVVFGTLALREPANRRALDKWLEAASAAWRVVDINLRPPFDQMETVVWVLARASLLKLNVDELVALAGATPANEKGIERSVRRLSEQHRITRICVTAGARGAGLLWDGEWHWVAGRPVEVRDTVGAGDAFLAALLAGLLKHGESPAVALTAACRLGEFVASQDGATPAYRCDAAGRPAASSAG